MKDAFTLYKLIILYTMDRVGYPMTNGSICEMMMELEYTSYFNVQRVLSEMTEDGLLLAEKVVNITQYTMSDEGAGTIGFFYEQISPEIRKEIRDYLKLHGVEIRNSVSHPAGYTKNDNDEYTVTCCLLEHGDEIVHLDICVPTEEAAMAACRRWKDNHGEIYRLLMEKLL